ncbi:nucleoside hydrolase [Oceanobacillus halotolerans]|uniref:nucleoside hydrolase n=1 Tax=Oceanobacillus halotolerans TaxID=2663380 RepID=UPI0013DBF47B|nr:nucleoside hydrolase [Oceanobacillus halotolerans]
MEKVILDVDTGIDDALAILLAAESKQLDILGVTAVNGNVPIDTVVTNTKKVLQLFDNMNTIPVYKGAHQPILRSTHYAFHVHGEDGLGGALQDMEVAKNEDMYAPDFIIEQARKHKGELTLIMVGPLTNLALAVQKEPRLSDWVKKVVVMGGLVSEGGKGNTLPTSEFNIYADAEAAKMVFHSGLRIQLVSLDVTLKAFLTKERIEQLKGTKYYEFVMQSTEIYREMARKKFDLEGCALHDPLTVGVVIDPTLVETETYYVDVETKGEISYGQTVCDFRNLLGKEPNVEICLDVDHKRFIDLFIETLRVNENK